MCDVSTESYGPDCLPNVVCSPPSDPNQVTPLWKIRVLKGTEPLNPKTRQRAVQLTPQAPPDLGLPLSLSPLPHPFLAHLLPRQLRSILTQTQPAILVGQNYLTRGTRFAPHWPPYLFVSFFLDFSTGPPPA
ncbi:hypothetical protein V2G26_008900 [Clonostachys chloroleuca]